ncbi:2-keto-4-pentenoate hydratase [Tropicibacter sp. Alg240-R139]|uniref:2-keto-4-pentenoate hydratase n=1 Tax=Tropicibacter sp. Alg240-R139 TaxID=2305991 RepID=UPI0013DF1211|nr:hydratase [Tropicibacter sp. Alg240-R139]
MRIGFFLLTAFVFCAGNALADCASDDEIAGFVADYISNTPTVALSKGGTMEDALCTQAKLVRAMEPHMGPVIGYKAGLTSKPAQERFNVTEPLQGVLYQNMMLRDGAVVSANWGARPVFEADLILVVGDMGINQAQTTKEVPAHVSAVHPFIELPDLTLAQGELITGVTLTAIGVAPKLGVLGAAIPVTDAEEMTDMLGKMQVSLTAADREVLAQVPGRAVLGHPANSVLWLISKGIEFAPGDMISIGSFGPLFPPVRGKGGAIATYAGLPGNPSVGVTFK